MLDRIGGGDGFVGGMLYGILRGWDPDRCRQFGWASGALAATFLTDYAVPADEVPDLERLGGQRPGAPLTPSAEFITLLGTPRAYGWLTAPVPECAFWWRQGHV